MRLLLDTHVWLWALSTPADLSPSVADAILRADEVVLSVASVWELAIKCAIGRISLPGGLRPLVEEAVRALDADLLKVDADGALAAAALPLHHKDPFDRMLVAQASLHQLTLVSADEAIRAYCVPILWARSA